MTDSIRFGSDNGFTVDVHGFAFEVNAFVAVYNILAFQIWR